MEDWKFATAVTSGILQVRVGQSLQAKELRLPSSKLRREACCPIVLTGFHSTSTLQITTALGMSWSIVTLLLVLWLLKNSILSIIIPPTSWLVSTTKRDLPSQPSPQSLAFLFCQTPNLRFSSPSLPCLLPFHTSPVAHLFLFLLSADSATIASPPSLFNLGRVLSTNSLEPSCTWSLKTSSAWKPANLNACPRVNRYSMPVTKSRTGFYDIGLDQANTTGFLFGDDDSAPEAKLYSQTNTDDNFPTLIRRDNMVSVSPSTVLLMLCLRHPLYCPPVTALVESCQQVLCAIQTRNQNTQ